jgi:hypothetical protein
MQLAADAHHGKGADFQMQEIVNFNRHRNIFGNPVQVSSKLRGLGARNREVKASAVVEHERREDHKHHSGSLEGPSTHLVWSAPAERSGDGALVGSRVKTL